MSGTGMNGRRQLSGAVVLMLLLGVALVVGCSGQENTRGDEARAPETTLAPFPTTTAGAGVGSESPSSGDGAPLPYDGSLGLSASLDRKIVSNANVLIEVERGRFQTAFDTALLLADKFGGYVVSSNSTATDEEGTIRSGTIALRVPETAFAQALSDVAKLGEVKSRSIDSQDVTEEYLDLNARLKNAESQEKAFLALMDRAKTIDEILQVRQVLSQTQTEIEQLKGRIRFLDEHTSFSTLTISLYETGTQVSASGSWGFVDALKDALHAFVDSINAIIVFFGGALPILVLLAILAWIAYKVIRPLAARLARGRDSTETPPDPPHEPLE